MTRDQAFAKWEPLARKLADATKECVAFMTEESLEKHNFWTNSVHAMTWFSNYLTTQHPPEPEKVTAVVKEKSTGKIISITEYKNGTQEKN